MKIPYEENQRVQPRGLPDTQRKVGADTGLGVLAAGVKEMGQGVGSAADQAYGVYQKAALEADHTAVNNAVSRLQDEYTSTLDGNAQAAAAQNLKQAASVQNLGGGGQTLEQKTGASAADAIGSADTPAQTVEVGVPAAFNRGPSDQSPKPNVPRGFLFTQGEGAVASSGQTLAHMQQVRAQLSRELSNDRQRQLFNQQTTDIWEAGRRQVERHVGQQIQVAKEASLEARKASALTAIANSYADPEAATLQTKSVETSIRALAVSKEDGDHRVAEWEASADATRLNQFLAHEDWKGAESLFAQAKDRLGVHAPQYEKQISEVRDNAEAEQLARGALRFATDKGGKVDADYALSVVQERAGDNVKLLDKARQRVEEGAVHLKQAYDAETKDISNAAFSAYNLGGLSALSRPYRSSTYAEQLNARNPELYNRLQDETRRKFREGKESLSELRRQQAEANKFALEVFQSLPPEDRAKADVDQMFAGYGATPVGVQALKVVQRQSIESIKKGQAEHEGTFVASAQAAFQGAVATKEGQTQLKAQAMRTFNEFLQQHQRPPNAEESQKLLGDMQRKVVLEQHWYRDRKGYQFQLDAKNRVDALKNAKPGASVTQGDAELLAPPAATKMPPPPHKTQVLSPKGKTFAVDEAGLDDWLKNHPGWKRK